MSHEKSPGIATKDELSEFFHVGDDKRNEILCDLGLSIQRDHDWTTIWAVLKLDAVQKRKMWKELLTPLLDVADVADIIKKRPKTVSGWCKKEEYPAGFPVPFNFGPRTKRWIALEVWAYRQPVLYGEFASQIARLRPSSRKVLKRTVDSPWLETTLEPMSAP